jgi:uncharacterized membrane protein YhaH (DUF805 family)
MVCPTCKLISPENTEKCDCGYNFLTGSNTTPVAFRDPPGIWSFDGRVGRGSFWGVFACVWLASFVAGLVIGGIGQAGDAGTVVGMLLNIVTLFFVSWLGLAVQVKRWHDLDKSGWMVLWNFTIIFIPISWIILGCIRGTKGPNQYGGDPLLQTAGSTATLAPTTVCGRCGESFPSGFYLEKSADGKYLCEKCRGIAQSAASA